jgi:hypothetical protein
MTENVNQASSTIATTALGGTRQDMTLTLQAGDGAKFPQNVPFIVTIGSDGDHHQERCRVTFISGDTLSLVRGIEGTPHQGWPVNTPVALEVGDPFGIGALVTQRNAAAPLVLKGNAAQALITSGTITTAGLSISRISLAGNATAVVLQAGTVDGQVVYVENTDATHTATFAAAATSHVQDGASDVIAAATITHYIWNATTGHWVRNV